MAAFFVDLDGSALKWGTNDFVPGAYERLKKFYDEGGDLIFTTQRDSVISALLPTEKFLKGLFPNCMILYGISSPRAIINDEGAVAINHKKNAAWNYNF